MTDTTATAIAAKAVTVTPAMALTWLNSSNTHNRTLRDNTVAKYARLMKTGKWPLNGEAIKFAADGTVLDGQHRLAACVLANASFTTFVITGLPPETQDTMDNGMARTASDMFTLHGEQNTRPLSAITRLVWMWDNGDRRFSGSARPSHIELADLLAKHPDMRRSADVATRIYGTFRPLPMSVLGTAHHLCSRVSVDDAVWFFARLGDGAGMDLGHPVLTLRQRASSDRDHNVRASKGRQLGYVMRAWNAYRERRTLTTIVHAADAACPEPH